MLGWMLQW
jgi:hypothetical protein